MEMIPVVQTLLVVFIISLFFLFIFRKTIKKLDFTQFFTNENTGKISHSKVWGNIAYFFATVAFVHLNLFTGAVTADLTMIWLIYLSVVASNAVASKFITYKYGKGN